MIQTRHYTNFLIEHKITPSQYLLLTLLYEREIKLISEYKRVFCNGGSMIPKEKIEDLVTRGFLTKMGDKYKLGESFIQIFVDADKAVEEIYELYPSFMLSDKGVSIPLNTMDRQIFKQIYIPKIMGNVNEHKEVLKDIQYAINNNLVTVGINKFLTSNQWRGFRKLRESQTPTDTPQLNNDF